MPRELFPKRVPRVSCYAMVTELSNRARFVKFGVSENPKSRLRAVQCGCPLRIEVMLEMDCGNEYHARVVESGLHLEHSEIHASGEWFRFAEGGKAVAQAREAMQLMGQKVFARAVVTETQVAQSKKPRMYRGKTTKTVSGYEPVVGDRDIAHVTVVRRRKPLKQKA